MHNFTVIFHRVCSFAASLIFIQNSIAVSDDTLDDAFNNTIPTNKTSTLKEETTSESYKFDGGFYQKIQNLLSEEQSSQNGTRGTSELRYYDVVIVVGRDDGDDRDPDEVARENKDAIAKRLSLIGAQDILVAESLSFVTASIPIDAVLDFSLNDEIYRLGDGELPISFEVDTAIETIHATPADQRTAVNQVYDGTGAVVGILDSSVNHQSLNGKVIKRATCSPMCNEVTPGTPPAVATHGTQIAQIITATGLPNHNGIATGTELLSIGVYGSAVGLAHSLDFALKNGADIVNMSFRIDDFFSFGRCADITTPTSTYNLIINEAVDKGMLAVKSAGNQGFPFGIVPVYQSITNPGCAHNIITVGGINDRHPNTITMLPISSRGPADDGRLKPEIVAPAYNINLLNSSGTTTDVAYGTSFAAPQVSAAAAILLDAHPDLTPVELKAALLLGADWQGPIPCTSSQYEDNDSADPCSFAMQPINFYTANNAASLQILKQRRIWNTECGPIIGLRV